MTLNVADDASASDSQSFVITVDENIVASAEKALEGGLNYLFSHQKEDGGIVTDEPGAEQAVLGATTLTVNGAARAPEQIRKKFEDKIASPRSSEAIFLESSDKSCEADSIIACLSGAISIPKIILVFILANI